MWRLVINDDKFLPMLACVTELSRLGLGRVWISADMINEQGGNDDTAVVIGEDNDARSFR